MKSPDRLIAKVRNQPDPLVPASTLVAEPLSKAMDDAIARSLALMEQERPQSVEAFRALAGAGDVPEAQSFAIQAADALSGEARPGTPPGTTVDRPLSAGPAIGATLPSAPMSSTPAPRPRPRGNARRAWGWIAAGSLMAVIVFGPGLDYWRSAIRGGEEAAMSPPTGGVREDDRRKREQDAPPRTEAPKRAQPAPEQPARPTPPPPSAASVSCDAMPKALAGAFADTSDCALIERTLRQALATAEPGTITRWTNTRTALSGTIKLSGAESRDGNVCRRAELAIIRGAETKRAEAVLCLKQGTWILVE